MSGLASVSFVSSKVISKFKIIDKNGTSASLWQDQIIEAELTLVNEPCYKKLHCESFSDQLVQQLLT